VYQSGKLAPEVRRWLRVCAAFLDAEISALVQDAITDHLDCLDHQRRESGLPPLPALGTERQS
jgi:hypothetical protein